MKTPEVVKSDPDFVSGIELPKQSFCVYLVFLQKRKILRYYAFWNEKLLFNGSNFKPKHKEASFEAMLELLTLLTLRMSDKPRKYFKKYTKAQHLWCCSMACEEISRYLSLIKDSTTAYNYFKMNFSN
jgi:hypothetical protein